MSNHLGTCNTPCEYRALPSALLPVRRIIPSHQRYPIREEVGECLDRHLATAWIPLFTEKDIQERAKYDDVLDEGNVLVHHCTSLCRNPVK